MFYVNELVLLGFQYFLLAKQIFWKVIFTFLVDTSSYNFFWKLKIDLIN